VKQSNIELAVNIRISSFDGSNCFTAREMSLRYAAFIMYGNIYLKYMLPSKKESVIWKDFRKLKLKQMPNLSLRPAKSSIHCSGSQLWHIAMQYNTWDDYTRFACRGQTRKSAFYYSKNIKSNSSVNLFSHHVIFLISISSSHALFLRSRNTYV
jgi:hypothetical protein